MKTIADLNKDFDKNRRSTRNACIIMIIVWAIFDLMIMVATIESGGLFWIGGLLVSLVIGCLFYFFYKDMFWTFSKKYEWDKVISEGKTKLFDTDGNVFVKKRALLITAGNFYYCPEGSNEEILVDIPDGKRNLFFLAYSEQFQIRTEEKMLIIFNDLSSIADMKRDQEIIKII